MALKALQWLVPIILVILTSFQTLAKALVVTVIILLNLTAGHAMHPIHSIELGVLWYFAQWLPSGLNKIKSFLDTLKKPYRRFREVINSYL